MIRFLDILFSLMGIIIGIPIFILIYIISLFDTGSPLFFQQRAGKEGHPFMLVKFRTMKKGTASVASHLASSDSITRLGRFLRKSKLDELPQLWNVLKGDMSLVGPRPCLFNQEKLIELRKSMNILSVRPGITGLAQINNIDMSDPELLAKVDREMIDSMNINNYFKFIIATVLGKGTGDALKR